LARQNIKIAKKSIKIAKIKITKINKIKIPRSQVSRVKEIVTKIINNIKLLKENKQFYKLK
jgi:hypothetical protein